MKNIPTNIKFNNSENENASTEEYRPPRSEERMIAKINKYILDGIDKNKITHKTKKDINSIIGYMNTFRFSHQINLYDDEKDRELFESSFVRYTYDKSDLSRVIDAARAVVIPADRSSLHVIPQEFKVDDQDGIRDPIGMMGTRLEAKVHIVTAAQSALQNIARCCAKRNLTPSHYVLQPLASAKAVLSKDEMELGVALVDIGGGTTDLAIFQNGSIMHTSVLPLGGAHVSQDLAIGLRTPQSEAERLKIAAGCALKSLVASSETVEVPSVGG
ncbi:MAG: cell division protein FtsA, partial [Proteobacteria bacterium]|nr:cell division protein FtsA [Pseudomonadota bacterium]